MAPVLLSLLLFPPLLWAQVAPDITSGATVEAENRMDSVMNGTSTSESPSSPEPTGSESTTPDAPEEDWSPAEGFLYSGDPAGLEPGECSRAYSPPGQSGPLPESFYAPLRPAMDALVNTANFLNMIFQASDLRESSVREDMEWYHALVRVLLEADLLVRRALLTFDADPATLAPQLVLRASRNPLAKTQTILLQDLSKAWGSLHPPAPAPDDSWFTSFKFPQSNQPLAGLSKRVLRNDLTTLDTPKWGQGDSYVTNRNGVRWADAPFLECKDGRFLPGWLLTLSTSFYGLKPDLTPEFRGVIRVDVNIQDFDVDQCATGDGWFADTHQCNSTTMECEPIPGQGFRLGQYCCRCKEGYYSPPMATQDTDGGFVNVTDGASGGEGDATVCYPSLPICLPCWPGCKSCQDGAPCWVEEDRFLRAGVLAVQGFFMLLVFISMLVAYRCRRSRRIRASGLLLLETILFGSLLLYFPVFILYFRPSTFRCILLRWVRMLGFAIVYGTVTLKMYRVLKVFLSRTAQRMPYMSSLSLLRMLGVMVVTVSWFLCAWTAGVLQNRDRNIPVLITSTTSDGQGFSLCYLDRWDYMMAVAELLFLCWGSSLCSSVKPVPSAFHEPRYMGIAIHNELLVSSLFHLLRFVLPSLHPDWMLLLFFTHTHVTITVTLALLFVPKFLHVSKPGREEIAAEVYEDEVDLRRSGSYLNSSFHSAWGDHSLDPDDIRDELKKLYALLEVHKTKKMTSNNPHLSKKRSSRRSLGRSLIKRISEIPESMSRQYSREDKEGSHRGKAESVKRAPDTISIHYKDELRKSSPSPVMRKSHSEHDYVKEKSHSLHDSMLRTHVKKRASQRSETDSLDIPPTVCKSASAQNLTIDNNLLHPDHGKLHKSLSLSSTNTHAIGTPMINRTSPVYIGSNQNIKEQTTSALQSESFDKAEICPWEVEEERPADKNQRHVTYAPSQDETPKSPDCLSSPSVHICPWDYLPPPEKKEVEADYEATKPQVQISASAPGSPRPRVTKDQRVFSFRTSTQKWLSVKTFVGSFDAKDKSEKGASVKKEDSVSQKSQESGGSPSITTKSASASNSSVEKKTLQRRALTEGKPCLVKQNAIRLSSGDSSDRSPRRLVIVKSAVYPWDLDDMQKDTSSMYENVFISRQNSTHSNASSWETGGTASRTPSTHRRGSNRIAPALTISHGDVCPWDVPGSSLQSQGPQRQQSNVADVCPWEVQEEQLSGRASVCPWESQEQEIVKRQGSGRTNVCPPESQDVPTNSNISVSKESQQSQKPLNQSADICPWESVETTQPSKRQDGARANVCPWDAEENVAVVYENEKPSETEGSLKVASQQQTGRSNVCPRVSEDTTADGKNNRQKGSITLAATAIATSAAIHFSNQAARTVESCPWEFPEPPKIVTQICPWEEESPEPSMAQLTIATSTSQGSITTKTDICPWETASAETEEKDSPRANICPWETEQPEKTVAPRDSVSKGLEKSQSKDNIRADVCPWDSEDPGTGNTDVPKECEKTKSQDGMRVNVCPWETEEPETGKAQAIRKSDSTQRQDSGRADVCPWETEEPQTVKIELSKEKIHKQVSPQADVCPWETSEPETVKKQDSIRDNVCPWETVEPKVLKKQDSTRTDVCPWEMAEPETIKEQDSIREDVCPWETVEPKVLKKQDSTRADVCPWETAEPETIKKQDSIREDVCPWETVEPKVLKKQDSTRADVCPWETAEPEAIKKQDSIREGVCPWETTTKVVKKSDSCQEDVCPWETAEPETVKKQDSTQVAVCPWEFEDPEKSPESQINISNSGQDEVTESQGPRSNEEPSADGSMQPGQEPKAHLPLGQRDALCPWEMEGTRSGSITDQDCASDVFTWEPENIPEEEEDDAETAAEAFVFPPDL